MASLKLKNVYKRYAGGVTAVSDFNLDIDDKEFLILVGPSGCGKSTTLKMIAGLEEITEGELYIGDRLVNEVAPKDRDIAMVFQNYALYPHMTVFENMAFGLKLRKTPKEEIKRRVDEAAAILDITQLLDKQPQALSSEQRQKVALGRAIVRKPKVFLMDEPLSNLEAKLRVQMRAELSKLHQRLETTFIYVTHDQAEAMMMGTRLVVMKDGFIQQIDSPEDLYSKPNNMFVAGFIGSPQMNFINVMVVKKDDQIHLVFGKNDIVLPVEVAKKLEDAGYIGREVVMGIRSENVYDEEADGVQMSGGFIKAKVQSVKTVGAETYLYMTVEGVTFIARGNPKTKVKAGEVIKVIIDMNKIHLFDADTQRAIIN